MPLIILGAIVVIAIIIYWYIGNQNSDEPIDPREIRDRYSHAFEEKARDIANGVGDDIKKSVRKRAGIFDVDYDVEDDGYGARDSKDPEDNTIPFPSDVEGEKRKRDIH
ncbi:MAG: hypothetical protein J6D07_02065 [Mogibacterium sp.]|nr:hypothetical protein [Mogibacterium sp.]